MQVRLWQIELTSRTHLSLQNCVQQAGSVLQIAATHAFATFGNRSPDTHTLWFASSVIVTVHVPFPNPPALVIETLTLASARFCGLVHPMIEQAPAPEFEAVALNR